ncbi:thrombospondin type-1 domain-containing protein 1 [Anguilla anguilla]|uniref:thrombospondin type-1 domain-containing protein 1 n=1 Tax=Anguilla anguilla TaxID=7936 RepID=UPI0015B01C56|nr:thrombospondin type-1 domain-containing protein 1 [Anguilla anguilla]XP_035288073.1 thrombospondin type-1 domain-containing protein 1 [Anguilla anguilla]
MTQGSTAVFPPLLVLWAYAVAEIHHWPSVHVALSNGSVFVDFNCGHNATDRAMTVSLVDIETNVTVLSRPLPVNQSEGTLEFNCTCFLYAGSFRFKLEQGSNGGAHNTTLWWSEVLRVQWPTFHIAVERTNNQSSNSFQIILSTNDYFQPCISNKNMSLYLEVSYLEYNQIGKNSIDKVRARTRRSIKVVKSQRVELDCAFPFTERDFIRVALKSPHSQRDIKSSGPLYLSRIFSYKLLVDNVYRAGCEGTVTVRLVPPPCAFTNGKVLLFREGGGTSTGDQATPPLGFNWLTQGENETEFNCSVFDPGRNRYCFRFFLNFSRSPSPAQACVIVQRNAETWGLWQSWSGCSVSCGEGVRERTRECLASSTGGMQCTGMVKEQSHCSLEDCTVPRPSLSPLPPIGNTLGGNLVAVAGISLCLVVILATVVIAVWRRACRAPKCSSVRRSSAHPPGGRKNSDEASICGHSLQRPSFSESLQVGLPEQGLPERGAPGRQQGQALPLHHLDPERVSPNSQKIVPPIFGYRLAHQQLKEMKKKGLKEATKVYHVSQSPIDDTMLETTTASTPAALTPVPPELDGQEEANLNRFRIKSPFMDTTTANKGSTTLPDRLSPRVDFALGPQAPGFGGSSRRRERTEHWVEMVERCGGHLRNPSFRRTSSFHETKQHQPSRAFRERSMTQVTPRQLPEGSCRARAWEQPRAPERDEWGRPKSRLIDSTVGDRRRPYVETAARIPEVTATSQTEDPGRPDLHGVPHAVPRGQGFGHDRAGRAEANWSRRGPSPIQRNILARKLKEANASATCHRQRSSTIAHSDPDHRRDKCRSLPDYPGCSASPYGLTESEQHMMDLSGYLGEEDSVDVLGVHGLT